MQNEYHELVDLGAGTAGAGRHDLAEVEPFGALRDRFQIVGIVVLAVDENNLLRSPGNIERALVDEAQIPRAQPAIGRQRFGVRLRILVVALRYVVAVDMDVADLTLAPRRTI